MTTSAIGLERRELPVDNFRIALMAISALQVVAVVQWLIRQTNMLVIRWRPDVRVVTQAAVLRRIKVPRILAGRLRTIVAGRAGSQNLIVVNRDHRFPDIGAVTIFADAGCQYMRRTLARSVGAVMAA